jgi:hypothetical protein
MSGATSSSNPSWKEELCTVARTPDALETGNQVGVYGRGIEWDEALEAARALGGYLVDFQPPTGIDNDLPLELPEWANKHVIGPQEVVDA